MTNHRSNETTILRNPRWDALNAETQRLAMAEWSRISGEFFAPPEPGPRLLQEELRRYERGFAKDMFEHSGHLKDQAHKILDHVVQLKSEVAIERPKWMDVFRHFEPVDPAPRVPPDGEFWWAFTEVMGNATGIQTLFLTDGLHFFGGIDYDGDPTIFRSIGARARFELHANRRPPSSFGRWRSVPFVELFGQIKGFTGVWIFPIAMDDKWCKCRLVLRQAAFQFTPGTPTVLAVRETTTVLLNEENEARWNFRNLDGFTPMPMIEFGLADPNLSVFVDLDVRFDIELEGYSRIVFVPGGDPMDSVLLRTFQWKVQPL